MYYINYFDIKMTIYNPHSPKGLILVIKFCFMEFVGIMPPPPSYICLQDFHFSWKKYMYVKKLYPFPIKLCAFKLDSASWSIFTNFNRFLTAGETFYDLCLKIKYRRSHNLFHKIIISLESCTMHEYY